MGRLERMAAAVGISVALLAGGAEGQETSAQVALTLEAGTSGIGALFAGSPSPWFGVRAGISVIPVDLDLTYGDIEYQAGLPSPVFKVLLDLYPTAGSLRGTGGFYILGDPLVLNAGFTRDVRIGTRTYAASQVGRLRGEAEARSSVPYLGLGWGGNPVPRRVGLVADLGVAFWGKPRVALLSSGPIGDTESFLADLDIERARVEEALSERPLFPVLTLGVIIPLGG